MMPGMITQSKSEMMATAIHIRLTMESLPFCGQFPQQTISEKGGIG